MSNVTLSIGGRSFTVACAEGEEDHVAGLGRMIDGKLSAMGDMAGQSEGRMLLFAALLLADELHEAHRSPSGGVSLASSDRLDAIATRLENLAESLEGSAAST
jgi:cell division protein ZapA